MRDETEWVETVELGWNRLLGADFGRITAAYEQTAHSGLAPYGEGVSGKRVIEILTSGRLN